MLKWFKLPLKIEYFIPHHRFPNGIEGDDGVYGFNDCGGTGHFIYGQTDGRTDSQTFISILYHVRTCLFLIIILWTLTFFIFVFFPIHFLIWFLSYLFCVSFITLWVLLKIFFAILLFSCWEKKIVIGTCPRSSLINH